MATQIGRVTHYFGRLGVAVLALEDTLRVGDCIRILGHTTEFAQVVCSMEINHRQIQEAGRGAEVALKVVEPARVGDLVYRLVGEEAEEARAQLAPC